MDFQSMGTKYLPTVKDQKATQRFQQKQTLKSNSAKPVTLQPIKKSKKK